MIAMSANMDAIFNKNIFFTNDSLLTKAKSHAKYKISLFLLGISPSFSLSLYRYGLNSITTQVIFSFVYDGLFQSYYFSCYC